MGEMMSQFNEDKRIFLKYCKMSTRELMAYTEALEQALEQNREMLQKLSQYETNRATKECIDEQLKIATAALTSVKAGDCSDD